MGIKKALKITGYSLGAVFGLAVAGVGALVADMAVFTEDKDVSIIGGMIGPGNKQRLVLTIAHNPDNDVEMFNNYASAEQTQLQPGRYTVTIGCDKTARFLGLERCIIKATPR